MSPQYTGPISISAYTTLKFSACFEGYCEDVKTQTYTITPEALLTTANPAGGIYNSNPMTVWLTQINGPNATIYYTHDGTDPKTNGVEYGGPITITNGTTLKFATRENASPNTWETPVKTEVYAFDTTLSGSISQEPSSFAGNIPVTVTFNTAIANTTKPHCFGNPTFEITDPYGNRVDSLSAGYAWPLARLMSST